MMIIFNISMSEPVVPFFSFNLFCIYLRLWNLIRPKRGRLCANLLRYLHTILWYRNTAGVLRSESLKSLRIAVRYPVAVLFSCFLFPWIRVTIYKCSARRAYVGELLQSGFSLSLSFSFSPALLSLSILTRILSRREYVLFPHFPSVKTGGLQLPDFRLS